MKKSLKPLRRWRPRGPICAAALVLTLASGAVAQSPAPKPGPVAEKNLSLKNELREVIDKGAAWLAGNQDPKGHWSNSEHPAISALALVALQGRTESSGGKSHSEVVRKGFEYLMSCVQADGSVYQKKQMLTYNTALSLLAFQAANRPEYKPVILKARQFLISLQNDFDTPGKADNVFDGGVGYGSSYQHSDMANTLQALEALYHSKQLAQDQSLAGAKDLNWGAAIQFIQNCQHLPGHNKQEWVSDDPKLQGGFIYYPGTSRAENITLSSGKVALRSYGSISYAGLLSYIYADLKRDDPRVQAVVAWLRQNYTLEENPGMGSAGLFYYLHTMTKALSLYGGDAFDAPAGKKVDWRNDVALKLMNLQRPDGSWANDNARWMEKDPALVTSYALLSLEMIYNKL